MAVIMLLTMSTLQTTLGDYKRQATREFVGRKFAEIVELSEKIKANTLI